ncbi:MAG: DNA repair protein RecO [Desulfonatronovibrio sp.]
MHFSEKVLITRTGRFKEYDLWVRFLSPSMGIMTGFAFGGCKSRRRFSGCLDTLNLVLFKASTGSRGQYLTLEEGTLICGFPEIKKDPGRLGMAVNSLRFTQKICLEGDDSSQLYSLMLDYLDIMENNPCVPSFFPLLYRAKAVFMHGYEPLFESCFVCGKSHTDMSKAFFLFSEGKVACEKCLCQNSKIISVHPESLSFLSRLRNSNPEKWISWNIKPEILQDCFQMVESFVEYHVDDSHIK